MDFNETKKALNEKSSVRLSEETVLNGVPVLIKQISAYGFEQYREYAESDDPQKRNLYRAKLIQMCMYHKESDKQLYGEKEIWDVSKNIPTEIDRLYWICMKVNGYGRNKGEEVLKNLLATLGEDGLQELRGIIDARLQSFSADIQPTSSSSSGSSKDSGPSADRQQT